MTAVPDQAVLDAPPRIARTAKRAPARSTPVVIACPECLGTFRLTQRHQLFCSRIHKRAYNNRLMKRGAVLAPLVILARVTRNGSEGRHKEHGRRASRDSDQLIQRWRDDDKAAGRMDVLDYVAARYILGLVDVA